MALAWSDLRTRLRNRLGEDTESGVDSADLMSDMNDVMFEIAAETKCLQGTQAEILAEGQRSYTLTETVLFEESAGAIRDVTIVGRRLGYRSRLDIEAEYGVSWTESGRAEYWFIENGRLFLVPPHLTSDEETMEYSFFARPTELTASDSVFEMPRESLEACVSGVLAKTYEHLHQMALADRYWAHYERHMEKLRRQVAIPPPYQPTSQPDYNPWV